MEEEERKRNEQPHDDDNKNDDKEKMTLDNTENEPPQLTSSTTSEETSISSSSSNMVIEEEMKENGTTAELINDLLSLNESKEEKAMEPDVSNWNYGAVSRVHREYIHRAKHVELPFGLRPSGAGRDGKTWLDLVHYMFVLTYLRDAVLLGYLDEGAMIHMNIVVQGKNLALCTKVVEDKMFIKKLFEAMLGSCRFENVSSMSCSLFLIFFFGSFSFQS